jgi:hypothetical protein
MKDCVLILRRRVINGKSISKNTYEYEVSQVTHAMLTFDCFAGEVMVMAYE